MAPPAGEDPGLHLPRCGLGAPAARGEADDPGARVGRVGDPCDVPQCFELVDEGARRLLGDLGALGELGEPVAVLGDPGGQPTLREGGLEAQLVQGVVDLLLHRAVGDEEQDADVRGLLGHVTPLTDDQPG